ncbi:MAG: hypothetical protein L3K15_01815 [Thermoplasmata archaeon]|nr:hypothetical protein [Thermoplasmata archaeon]
MTSVHRVLREEYACFGRESERLLASDQGKYVLIRGAQVVGIFSTEAEAIRAGYDAFGPVPFFVRQIRPDANRLRLDLFGRSP